MSQTWGVPNSTATPRLTDSPAPPRRQTFGVQASACRYPKPWSTGFSLSLPKALRIGRCLRARSPGGRGCGRWRRNRRTRRRHLRLANRRRPCCRHPCLWGRWLLPLPRRLPLHIRPRVLLLRRSKRLIPLLLLLLRKTRAPALRPASPTHRLILRTMPPPLLLRRSILRPPRWLIPRPKPLLRRRRRHPRWRRCWHRRWYRRRPARPSGKRPFIDLRRIRPRPRPRRRTSVQGVRHHVL